MVDRVGRHEAGWRCVRLIILAGLSAFLLSACAGTSIPPLRPDLPDDLRQPTGPAPDFRQPLPEQKAATKTPKERSTTVN